MTTLTREQAAKRFAELPLPSTSDEHWRFTDLRGFDPQEVPETAVSDTKPALDLDVAEARKELEAKGVAFEGDVFDTSVCHMAHFKDPDGNVFMLHRRYAPPA
jgi:hypothetical protein